MIIKVFDNALDIAREAGDIFIGHIQKFPDTVLGLATGASPVATYKYLISQYEQGAVSFSHVKTFNLDEYCNLPEDDSQSYHTFMRENLFSHVDINMENTHFPNGNAANAEVECDNYDKMILEAGGIDIQLLGIGNNGHIGFNEPSDEFSDKSHKVKLTDSTIAANSIYFEDGNMPRYAVTMGVGSIMRAKKIILIATGEAKANAVHEMIKGAITPRCPASILQKHNDAVILLDQAAAKLL